MALSQEELKIVEQMKQMGATNAQISGFIGKGRLGLTPTFPVERVQEQRNELGLVESRFSETGKDIAQMFDGLMATAKKTYAKQKEALGASIDGQQGIGRGFAQAVGIGAGGVSEGIGEVVKGGVKVALSQEQEESLKSGIGKVVKPIAESKTLKALIEKYESLSDEQKRDVQAIGGGLMFGADVLGLGVGGKAVKEGTKAVKQIPKFFPEGQVLKNADEVIDFVAKTEKVTEPVEKTAKNLSKSEVDLPQMTLQEKWIGLEPSFKKKIQNQPEKMKEYINVVKARNNDIDMPSVYEYAGDNARIAVADMERILGSTGSKIGQTRTKLGSYSLDIDQVKSIEKAFANQLNKLNLRIVEGRILKDTGKISKVSNSELNALAELYENINVLKRSPNLTNAIDLRNVFDNKINFGKSAREISGILDPVSRETRAEIATQTAKLVGKTEAKNIADYSDFMKAYEGLKGFTDRNAGGEYLLRVFMSGRGGEASDVIKTIANYTGKDLSVDAVMMTLVTDLMGNSTQKNLFRQEITKAGIDAARILSGDPTGAIPLVAEFAKKRLLDPEDILKTASGVKKKFDPTKQGGFVKNPLAKTETNLTQEAKKYKSAEEFVKAQKPNNSISVTENTKELNIKDLYAHGASELKDAIRAVKNGSLSKTNAPIQVTKLPTGEVVVLDGQHRVIQAINKGQSKINIEFLPYEDAINPEYGITVRNLIQDGFEGTPFQSKSQLTDIWNKANKK